MSIQGLGFGQTKQILPQQGIGEINKPNNTNNNNEVTDEGLFAGQIGETSTDEEGVADITQEPQMARTNAPARAKSLNVGKGIKKFFKWCGGLFKKAVDAVSPVVDTVVDTVQKSWNTFTGWCSDAWKWFWGE